MVQRRSSQSHNFTKTKSDFNIKGNVCGLQWDFNFYWCLRICAVKSGCRVDYQLTNQTGCKALTDRYNAHF